jgi:hypothetical protein
MNDSTSEQGFQVKFAFVAWVPPLKLKDRNRLQVESRILDAKNKAFNYFLNIFEKALGDCKTEIQFKSPGLNQANEVRSHLLDIVSSKTQRRKEKSARALAERLASVTDERSGNGLFVLIEGQKLQTTRILLNRFRSDEVVFTRHAKQELIVGFFEEAFTKRSHFYKSAVFEDIPSNGSFWHGFAIDKQIVASTNKEISSYWITDFLDAQSAITSVQGTMNLAKAMRAFLQEAETLAEKEQIISALLGLKNKTDKPVSIESVCKDYLSDVLYQRFKARFRDDYFFNSVFTLDPETYQTELGSTIVGLENGLIITAPTFDYKKYVKEEVLPDGATQVSLSGRLHDKKLAKGKRVDQ